MIGWPLLALTVCTAPVHHDLVRVGQRHQTLENFGASDAWTFPQLGSWSEASRNRLADLLFSTDRGIGLSAWRFYVGAGVNHKSISNPWRTLETFETAPGRYDWTRQATQRWFLQAAKARGVGQFVAFACSPPGRLTVNGLTNGGPTGTTNLKPGAAPEFARYLADIVAHLREAEGIPCGFVSPINEPQWAWEQGSQEGCRYANAELRAVIGALHTELTARKLPVAIIAPESGSLPAMTQFDQNARRKWGAAYGNYLNELADDLPALDQRLAYHSYWSDDPGKALVQNRQKLGAALAKRPELRLWQSEYCVMQHKRDLGMTTALDVARIIHLDLAVVGASAWQWWLALSSGDYKDGLLFTDWHKQGDPESLITSKLFWALGNYSRFLRPGEVRVDLLGENHSPNGLLGSAWRRPDGGLVLVYVNRADAPQALALTCEGGPLPRWSAWVTDEQRDLAPLALGETLELPARSVVTLVGA